jgi:hypothetical protein
MTARKMREHLTLAEAKAMHAEATRQGGMLLIYKESNRDSPTEASPAVIAARLAIWKRWLTAQVT